MILTAVEARVLGSLMEKEMSTPEYYPLSLNALLAACNQRSSRDPVMTLAENEVRGALQSLEDADLVRVDHGSRVERYEHQARTVFQLRRDETALLCLLLLRGPQTAGELRGRSDRLFGFEDLPAVTSALSRMSAPLDTGGVQRPAIAMAMVRQPGAKEQRYRHALTDVAELDLPVQAAAAEGRATRAAVVDEGVLSELRDRVRVLELAVEELRGMVQRKEPDMADEDVNA